MALSDFSSPPVITDILQIDVVSVTGSTAVSYTFPEDGQVFHLMAFAGSAAARIKLSASGTEGLIPGTVYLTLNDKNLAGKTVLFDTSTGNADISIITQKGPRV